MTAFLAQTAGDLQLVMAATRAPEKKTKKKTEKKPPEK